MAAYEGSCHCGGLRFEYRTAVPTSTWSLRACQCSFCRAHQGLVTSDPASTILFRETVAGALQRYRFGLNISDFLICSRCGVYMGVVMADKGETLGIININALREKPSNLPVPQSKDYGGEAVDQRIARRRTAWSRAQVVTA